MAFLKIIWSFVNWFRNYGSYKVFSKFSSILNKQGKHCNSENIEDFRKFNDRVMTKYLKFLCKFKEIGH